MIGESIAVYYYRKSITIKLTTFFKSIFVVCYRTIDIMQSPPYVDCYRLVAGQQTQIVNYRNLPARAH